MNGSETVDKRRRDNFAIHRKRIVNLHNSGRGTCAFGCAFWDASGNCCSQGIVSGGGLVAEKCHLRVPTNQGPVEHFKRHTCQCGRSTTRTDGVCYRCCRKTNGKEWRATDEGAPRDARYAMHRTCAECVHLLKGECSLEFPEARHLSAAKHCAAYTKRA
jgi:hypothetical protein